MASISSDDAGRRLVFSRPRDGRRVAVRLGHVSMREAREIKVNVEALISCAIAGTSIPDELSKWAARIGDRLHRNLVRHGLITGRRRVQLGEFLDCYAKDRKDVKKGTAATYATSINRIFAFFERERYIHEITLGDADSWLVSMRSRKKVLSEASISKTIKHAKQFFDSAIRHGLVDSNPFAGLKAPSQENEARQQFITQETIAKVIDTAPDHEWRLLIRQRYLRCS